MWTPAARAELARASLPYATCLTDAEGVVVAPLLPAPATTGRPRLWPLRSVLDAILYVLRTGCAWRHLPRDFPPWPTGCIAGTSRLSQAGVSWPFLARCFADQAYRGERVGTATPITVEIVRPRADQKGFAVQPRRWVIERAFGWIGRCRRLARRHEATPSSALAFVLAATMIRVRRLAPAL